MNRKILRLGVALTITLGLVGCGSSNDTTDNETQKQGETIVIEHVQGETEVPLNPQKIVVLDYAALDIVDGIGAGDKVVGVPKSAQISFLDEYMSNEKIENLGSLKEIDMEKLYSLQPDLIISGGRSSEIYDELNKIAPTIEVGTDEEVGYMNSLTENVSEIASVFEKEETATKILNEYQDRIDKIAKFAQGKDAIVSVVTGGSTQVLSSKDRASLISNEIGFNNLYEGATADHGEQISFEYLVKENPEYLFVLDRDAAISAKGSKTANEVLENELVKDIDAYKNGNIIYLNPEAWYLVEGGLESTNIMISDIENILE